MTPERRIEIEPLAREAARKLETYQNIAYRNAAMGDSAAREQLAVDVAIAEAELAEARDALRKAITKEA